MEYNKQNIIFFSVINGQFINQHLVSNQKRPKLPIFFQKIK